MAPIAARRSAQRYRYGVSAMSEDRRTAEEIIPVIEEQVVIGRERASTGTVRVRTVIHEDEHAIDEPVTITDVEVKRVPVDLWTDEPIADRLEGDTRIISVHREEIIVQRRLHVIEEVHVTLRGEKNVTAKSCARNKARLLS